MTGGEGYCHHNLFTVVRSTKRVYGKNLLLQILSLFIAVIIHHHREIYSPHTFFFIIIIIIIIDRRDEENDTESFLLEISFANDQPGLCRQTFKTFEEIPPTPHATQINHYFYLSSSSIASLPTLPS
jgi:hypothetical protein